MELFIRLVFSMAWFVFSVWIVMLSLGAAHSYYEGIPALGYMATLWLTVAFSWLFSPSMLSLLTKD